MREKLKIVWLIVSTLFCLESYAIEEIRLSPTADDMTPLVYQAIEGASSKDVKIILEKGIYQFKPDYAFSRYSTITNHGNGLKNVVFLFEDLNSVEIEGNGSELIFHGQIAPFQFNTCQRVSVSDVTIDWDVPFTFLGEVIAVNKEDGWLDLKPAAPYNSWEVYMGHLLFPGINHFNYNNPGSSLAFDKESKRVVHGALDLTLFPFAENKGDSLLRIHQHLRWYPPIGSLLNSKGDRHSDRYAPAIHSNGSSNVSLTNVVVHHALGMAYLFERTDGVSIKGGGVFLREGAPRVVSSTADATHFANCKGDILIDGCRFENMLDDATNVHGTYVKVDEVKDSKTLRLRLEHFEQKGFVFAEKGDEVNFILAPHVKAVSVGTVQDVKFINERFTELVFEEDLPEGLKTGDLLENKTWNPTFTMRNCSMKHHRARNIVLKTPRKTVIENNYFSSMMSSIFFRGESFFWYENGAVEDVLIQNNTFEYCCTSGGGHAILNISPRLGKAFNQDELYDRNIRFVNNAIKTFGNRIVKADRVDGLLIKGNTIIQDKEQGPQLESGAPMFDFVNCKDVVLEQNSYTGDCANILAVDKKTVSTINNDGSIK